MTEMSPWAHFLLVVVPLVIVGVAAVVGVVAWWMSSDSTGRFALRFASTVVAFFALAWTADWLWDAL